jgi:hypothetical protein
MVLAWERVTREDVKRACELIRAGQHRPRTGAKGIFVAYQGERLPAKHVLRLAYCLAHELPLGTNVRFTSGEGTITRLRGLGFDAGRERSSSE